MTDKTSVKKMRACEPSEAEFSVMEETLNSVLIGIDILSDFDRVMTKANKKDIKRAVNTLNKLKGDILDRQEKIGVKQLAKVNKEVFKNLNSDEVTEFLVWKAAREENTLKEE